MQIDKDVIGAWAMLIGMISIIVIICVGRYLSEYTVFFERLFGMMELGTYYKEQDYIRLCKRFRRTAYLEVGGYDTDQMGVAEMCRWANIADQERWSGLAVPAVVDALSYLNSVRIKVDIEENGGLNTAGENMFEISLYRMKDEQRAIANKYAKEYCCTQIRAQQLIQFTNKLREDLSDPSLLREYQTWRMSLRKDRSDDL